MAAEVVRAASFFLVLAGFSQAFNGSFSHEYRLMKDMLGGYNPVVRPRYNSSQTVEVNVRFSLQQIYDLDDKRQILTISGWLTTEWVDEFLRWDPKLYGGLRTLIVNPKKIWSPKLAIGNSAGNMFYDWKHFWITVHHDGGCRWQPGGNFAFTCALDINYYPFDSQKCTMEIETWYYTSDKVKLHNTKKEFGLETYLQHGEWAIESTSVERVERVYGYYLDEAFPEIYFVLNLRRKYTFYFMYILLPCIMLSFVILLIFLLPAESGEKVSLGVSILVCFSLFLIVVAEQVPDTSDAVPVMAIYLMYFMMATALSVMTSTFIIKLHYCGLDRPPAAWLRILVFDLMAPLLCLKSVHQWGRRHQKCMEYHSCISGTTRVGSEQYNGSCHQNTPESETFYIESNEIAVAPSNGRSRDTTTSEDGVDACSPKSCFSETVHIKEEWKKFAEVLDRFFFYVFLVFILIPLVSLIGFMKA